MTEGVDETVRTLQTSDVDVLLLACEGREDDRSLQIIDNAHRAAPTVPIVVLSTSSPNGFLRRAFEAGATDMALYPQSKEQLRFVMSKAIARAPSGGELERPPHGRAPHLRPRPEGRHGEDADGQQPRASRSPSPVSA